MGRGERILVTGGAGYVGSHVCLALADAGFEPVVYDNFSRGHRWAVRFGPLETGDINDAERLAEVFRAHAPAAVVHLAALAFVGESVAEPERYRRNNVDGSLALIDAALAAGVRRVVFSSSCAVYGPDAPPPIGEDAPFRPESPYARSKVAVETALRRLSGAGRLAYAALRYFNAAGAAPDDGLGEDHDPEHHLVPLALDAAAGRRDPLTVFGEDYPTPDGTCVRDYVHVLDLADAHVRALDYLRGGGDSVALNLGTGQGHSVKEVIATVGDVTGRAVPTVRGARRPGDAAVLVADTRRARSLLGWRPRRAALRAQVGDAWAWSCLRAEAAAAAP